MSPSGGEASSASCGSNFPLKILAVVCPVGTYEEGSEAAYATRLEEAFGVGAKDIFDRTQAITIVACGTSYYADSVAR